MISYFKNIKDIVSSSNMDIDLFLSNIEHGIWIDQVIEVRKHKRIEDRRAAKAKLPNVTISGEFSERRDNAIIKHSGFIAIDIDDYDPTEIKSILAPDKYVYAVFDSVTQTGSCAIFKIDGRKHKEAFRGISQYLYDEYDIHVDQSCSNVSRARFVSYDPNIYINKRAYKFTKYIANKKPKKEGNKRIIFVKNDFDSIINEINSKDIDLTEKYEDWLKIGFAFANEFGESGRDYFHAISQHSHKYDPIKCNEKYDNCLKTNTGKINIASFYYLAKEHGIETQSAQTKEIIQIVAKQKKSDQARFSKDDSFNNIKEFLNPEIPDEDLKKIIDKVTPEDAEKEQFNPVVFVQNYFSKEYDLRKNECTGFTEIKNKDSKEWQNLTDSIVNSIYLDMKTIEQRISNKLVETILDSDRVQVFHPVKHFVEKNKHLKPSGLIKKLSESIESKQGLTGDNKELFIKKWLVGLVQSTYEKHSPLMLVLVGEKQGTGKTEFFRRLLPDELKPLMVSNDINGHKDTFLTMCKNLLFIDDEMSGKSTKDYRRMKEILSTEYKEIRKSYGRNAEKYRRLCIFGGCSNDSDILIDKTGNRRFIPIDVQSIDHDLYNSIDKTELFMEIYHLFESGYRTDLSRDEIALLNKETSDYEEMTLEDELIGKYCEFDEDGFVSSSEVIDHICRHSSYTPSQLSIKFVGIALQNLTGEKSKFKKIDRKSKRGHKVRMITDIQDFNIPPVPF